MTALDVWSARRRYLLLTALRWLPVGFLAPIFVLIPLSRGLSLTEIGFVFALQGLVVLALELPTGGLSDALGRRPVVIGGVALFTLASIGCALTWSIQSLWFFRALQGAVAGAGWIVFLWGGDLMALYQRLLPY